METSASPRKRHALHLFTGLPGQYGPMGAVLSFGQDPRWRRALVRGVAPGGEHVLDVAAGTGLVTAELIRQGAAHVTGVDQSEAMLDGARARVAGDGALRERVELVRAEAERLPFADGAFEVLTFTYLLRYVDDRAATMRELVRVLAPGRPDRNARVRRPLSAGRCGPCGACTRASVFPCSAVSSPGRGSRSAAFWVRTSSGSTPPSRTSPASGAPPGSPTSGCGR